MDKEQESRLLDTLYQISKIAAEAHDLPGLWEPLIKIVVNALKVNAGTIMTLEGETLVRQAANGLPPQAMQEPPIPKDQGGVSWGAVTSKKPAVIENLETSQVASKVLAGSGFHSLVTVPMMARDQIIGVLSVFTLEQRKFSEKDLNLISAVANQAATAIVSIRSTELLAENRERMKELQALNELSKSVSTLFNFEETLLSIIRLIAKLLRADQAALTLFNHEDKLLRAVKPAYGLTDAQINDFRLRPEEGLTGQCFFKGIPLLGNTIDPETRAVLMRAKMQQVKSLLVAPLRVKSQTLGVFHLFSDSENNFTESDVRFFAILASQAAIVVNSSYMYQEIAEERKKDDALLSSIGEGVMALDREGQIILLNAVGEKITGYLEEETLGKEFLSLFALQDKQQNLIPAQDSPVCKVLGSGKPLVWEEIYLKRRNGEIFPCWLSCSATRDAEDRIIGAIVVFRDITKDLELEQMKHELISIATHELRTPITGIKGYLDMVLEGDAGEINPEAKAMLQEVVKINERLADLVDDLLNVGRVEQGRIEVKPVAMDLANLVESVVKELKLQAEAKKLNLIVNPGNLPQVKADPDRVKQVLVNLIGNAVKYTEAGQVEVTFAQDEKMVICNVRDTGIGMKPEEQKHLFEQFYRAKNEKTRQIIGTGLGLWITKKIVEMMGGKIWVESVEGKGSTFSFSLPKV